MSQSGYQYTADSGQVYLITLPDDFAVAMGNPPASGGLAYLPPYLSPRYANFTDTAGNSRSAVACTQELLNLIPTPLIVDGDDWFMSTLSGETTNKFVSPTLLSPLQLVGPLGPPGPSGPPGPGFLPLWNISYPSGGVSLPAGVPTKAIVQSSPQPKGLTLWHVMLYMTNYTGSWQEFSVDMVPFLGSGVANRYSQLPPDGSPDLGWHYEFMWIQEVPTGQLEMQCVINPPNGDLAIEATSYIEAIQLTST